MNAADVLDNAATLIERDGWCRRVLETADGRHCAVGAMSAFGRGPAREAAHRALEKRVQATTWIWNDNQTDRRKVVRTMRRVARELRGHA